MAVYAALQVEVCEQNLFHECVFMIHGFQLLSEGRALFLSKEDW